MFKDLSSAHSKRIIKKTPIFIEKMETSSTSRSKVQETFRLLERVKKHFKSFHKNCAKKKSSKQYSEMF